METPDRRNDQETTDRHKAASDKDRNSPATLNPNAAEPQSDNHADKNAKESAANEHTCGQPLLTVKK
jgi:hypothetical protein